MHSRLGKNLLFLLLIGFLTAFVLLGTNFLAARLRSDNQLPLPTTVTPPSNVIVRENAFQGTTSWAIPSQQAASTQIQAYASATSVLPGQTLTFYVSTEKEGMLYSIGIYRLGWYRGDGGRLLAVHADLIGHAQGYYDISKDRLVDCNTCYVDKKTGLVEANWQPSYSIVVPSDWMTGVYLAKFADAQGLQSYVTFDVKGNPRSTYIVVTPDATNAAYNFWGGASLYQSFNSRIGQPEETPNHGVKVSFDRPDVNEDGAGQVLLDEVNAIDWLERQGYDLSYMSSADLQENPQSLLQHRAYLSLGHDEYWTKEMRAGVENARNHGVGLAFLGADDVYWQIRFEPDSKGTPNRTVVCYKVETGSYDLGQDPLYGRDNTRLTTKWRDPVLNQPENSLIGIMYSSLTRHVGFPWKVSPSAKSSLLTATGLIPGQYYGCDIVGNEWDRVFNNGATPAHLQILATSPATDYTKASDFSDTTYYVAPSGALVFASGSIYWTNALGAYRFDKNPACSGQNLVVPSIQRLLANVMGALAVHHSATSL